MKYETDENEFVSQYKKEKLMYRKILIKCTLIIIIGILIMQKSYSEMDYEKATLAGGCFWCLEPPFEDLDGVQDVVSGYIGGTVEDPTYEQVCTGKTGHYEAVQITYDPSVISYEKLLETFWRQIDPTDPGGQFADRGSQYQTAIFYHNDSQKQIAQESKQKLDHSGIFDRLVVTKILPAATFYPAEEYHQDYYKTCPVPYKRYRAGSGRESFLEKTWKE